MLLLDVCAWCVEAIELAAHPPLPPGRSPLGASSSSDRRPLRASSSSDRRAIAPSSPEAAAVAATGGGGEGGEGGAEERGSLARARSAERADAKWAWNVPLLLETAAVATWGVCGALQSRGVLDDAIKPGSVKPISGGGGGGSRRGGAAGAAAEGDEAELSWTQLTAVVTRLAGFEDVTVHACVASAGGGVLTMMLASSGGDAAEMAERHPELLDSLLKVPLY